MRIYDPKIPLLGTNSNAYVCDICSPEDIYWNVHSSTYYNSLILETPQKRINSGMDRVKHCIAMRMNDL